MLTSFFRSLFNSSKRSEKSRRSRGRLQLESLEARVLLSAGDFDPTFDNNGIVTQDFDDSSDVARKILVPPGGGSFVIGTTENTDFGGDDFAVAAFNQDGSPDTSFSLDGRTAINFSFNDEGTSHDIPFSAALQSDGKLIVVGVSDGQAAMLRLNLDGSLDTSFGSDGTGTITLSESINEISLNYLLDITIDSNDRIVSVGVGSLFSAGNPRSGTRSDCEVRPQRKH